MSYNLITGDNTPYKNSKAVKATDTASFRIESDCPVSSKCGGCSFRNVSYDEELRYKKGRVQDELERIGKLDIEVEEIIGADKCSHYRNKAQYPVSICDGELFAGFYISALHHK